MGFHQQEAMSWWLAGVLAGLVLLFDLLAMFLPETAGQEVAQGSVVTVGIVFAVTIVISVIAAAVFYVRRLNREEALPNPVTGATPD